MVKVDKIAHLLCQLAPFCREFHHILPTSPVILLGRDILVRLLVINIFLSYSELFLYTQLHGEAVCIPSGLAMHLHAAHGLIAVECVFDAAGEHMVNTRMAVCRRRSLEENKFRTSLAFINTLMEDIVPLPLCQHFLIGLHQIHAGVLCKLFCHFIL